MSSNHNQSHYIPWRATRISKLEEIFDKKFFYGKNILECGAGTGLVGKDIVARWNADVSFTEGKIRIGC